MITFITDTGCDLRDDVKLPYELKFLPLRVYVKGREYEDKVTISPKELYDLELQGEVASTSLPKPEVIEKTIEDASKNSEHVYVITISSKLSNTHDLILSIVNNINVKNVTVLDSKTASIKQAYVVLKAMEVLTKKGTITQVDINRFVENSLLVFFVPTLEYLYRGGRIGKAKALFGKLLSIKPILTTDDEGEVNTLGTVRSLDMGLTTMTNLAKNFAKTKGFANHYSLMGGHTIETMRVNMDRLISVLDSKELVGISTIGAAISAHVGPEAFGIVIGEKIDI